MSPTDHFEERVRTLIESSIATKQTLLESKEILRTLAKAGEALADALKQGNKVLLFGNGGSAADAQHIAAEFVGRFGFDRPALPALALSVNTSSLTAIGNDYGFNQIFSRQIEAFGRPGDVAIGISTSGNSQNVLDAIGAARKMGLRTITLVGGTGGRLKDNVDYCICVPSSETPRIQECHILIGHILSEIVEVEIFAKDRASR
jgi:D-sedoheptulose 7-phosphate isomerase